MDRDSILTGIVLGVLTPVLGYILIEQIFSLLTSAGLMDAIPTSAETRRARTVGLLAICCNLLPFRWSRLNYYDHTLRGIVFPTIVYVAAWVYKYYSVLF